MKEKAIRKKAFVHSNDCVACGVCMRTCPITIVEVMIDAPTTKCHD